MLLYRTWKINQILPKSSEGKGGCLKGIFRASTRLTLEGPGMGLPRLSLRLCQRSSIDGVGVFSAIK